MRPAHMPTGLDYDQLLSVLDSTRNDEGPKELMGTSRMIHKEGIDDTHPNQTKPTFRTRHVKINTLVSNSLSHGTEISMHRWHRDSVGYTYSADSDRLEQKWGQHRRSN